MGQDWLVHRLAKWTAEIGGASANADDDSPLSRSSAEATNTVPHPPSHPYVFFLAEQSSVWNDQKGKVGWGKMQVLQEFIVKHMVYMH